MKKDLLLLLAEGETTHYRSHRGDIKTSDLVWQAASDGAIDMQFSLAWYFREITEREVLEELSRIYGIRKALKI